MPRILTLLTLSLFLYTTVSALQGGGGESTRTKPASKTTVRTKPASKPKVARPGKPSGTIKGSGTKRGPSSQPKSAPVTISVSEAEAEVFLTDRNGKSLFETDSQFTNADKTPITIDNLIAGTYILVVRKAGYFEERRAITIVAGKPINLPVNLRASTAFLTISGNSEGATIDVENLGTFQGELHRQQVKPGTYRIKISKKGYISDSHVVELKLLGEESTVIFSLRPIPIASLLADAEIALREKNLDRAIEILSQILEIEPNNSKGNLLMGKTYFQKAQSGAGTFLITAIRLGETVLLPVRLYNKDRKELVAGDLLIDRNYVQIKFSDRADLNFSIFKPEMTGLLKSPDNQNITNITYRGKGDSNGKKADRKITIYSQQAALRADRSEVFCPQTSGGVYRCNSEADSLYDLIFGWQTQLR